jgi:hypothetical protein
MATVTKGKTFVNGELVTPAKIHDLVDLATVTNIQTADLANSAVTSAKIADGTIVNGDISPSAAIADTKLATISTAGKVANTATTAQHNNTPNAIVARNALGDFFANTITANLSGNASTATKLATARTLSLTGDVSGSVSFDGSANATITAAVLDDSHSHVIANVDNLQTALDAKVTNAGSVSAIQRVTSMPASPNATTLYIVIP